jgi:hypothetical protein
LSELGHALGGHDCASLEMHLEAAIERVWTSTGRQSMDGAVGVKTLFIRKLTCKCGNGTM